MADLYRDLTLADASRYQFLTTLLSDLEMGRPPKEKPDEKVATVKATPKSPDEVRIEYGSKNRWGEYGCHVVLTRNGALKDRNCWAFYTDGTRTLAKGAKRKEAQAFLKEYRFNPLTPPTFRMDPVRVAGTPPMPGGVIIIQRARLTFDDPQLERQD